MLVSPSLRNHQNRYSGDMAGQARHSAQLLERDTDSDIALLLAFLNTAPVADGDTDTLDDEQAWLSWAAEHGLGEPRTAGEARAVRDAMRNAITRRQEPEGHQKPGAQTGRPVRIELRDGLPTLVTTDAPGTLLCIALSLTQTGHWQRLKICGARDCWEAFYDHSRNSSRTWCSMRACGNREKARMWRQRRAST